MANSNKFTFFKDEEPISEILQQLQDQPAQAAIPEVNLGDLEFLANFMDNHELREQLFPRA